MTIITRSVFEEIGKDYPEILFVQMFVWVIKILQYERINISEGIDTNKTSASKECMLCHYWYFQNIGYKFESNVCNKCHDVLMTPYELKNIAILNVKDPVYICSLWGISGNETVK